MLFSKKSEKELLEQSEEGGFGENHSKTVWKRFRKNRLGYNAMRVLYALIFVAIFSDFIANERPLYCQIEGETYFPVMHEIGESFGLVETYQLGSEDWPEKNYDRVIFPLIPYSADRTNLYATDWAPFETKKVESLRWTHWLGTDRLGRDVLASLIKGTRNALLVGIIAMSIALLIGIPLGAFAGYFGDRGYRVSLAGLLFGLLGIGFGLYYGFFTRWFPISEAGKEGGFGWEVIKGILIFSIILMSFLVISRGFKRIRFFMKEIYFPVDLLVMRGIEVFNSIPTLLLLLSLVAILEQKSILYVMVIIGFIRWTGIARFTRAEMLRIKNLGYIESARALGFSNFRIIFKHALPNALGPILITTAFGIAGAILAEATLSFLNIGIGDTEITWGKLLTDARSNFKAWWLALFPGLAIFITVTIFNLIGEGLTSALQSE